MFAGTLTGPVVTSPSVASYIGSAVHDSNAAEMSGFAWASMFILQHAGAGYTRCKVFYDTEFAAHAATGTWNVGQHATLSKVEHALYNMVQAVSVTVLEHEKSPTQTFRTMNLWIHFARASLRIAEMAHRGVGMVIRRGLLYLTLP